jgi:hypothetical protein
MRGSLALSRPHRVSFPARCGRVASSRDRGRRLVRHGSTDVGQPAFGAARHAKSALTLRSLAVLFALEWCAQSPTAYRAPGELTHTKAHIYASEYSRWLCASSDAGPDGSNESARGQSTGRLRSSLAASCLHFAPVRAGKARSAPPPTGRLTTSGCFWGSSSLRARARGRMGA